MSDTDEVGDSTDEVGNGTGEVGKRTDEAQLEADLAFAIDAAREAGRRLQRLRELGRWEDAKVLGDVGDQAADGYLQGMLFGARRADGVLSEETADSADRLAKARAWIVDPLDGTKEYRTGRDDWAVHVALCQDGRPAVGAVALPAIDRVLWGVSLPGRERGGCEGDALDPVAGDSPQPDTIRVACSRSHTPEWMDRFRAALGHCELVPTGSVGFKVGRLLAGEADVYAHKNGLKEWDTCAPEAVARAFGWHVSDVLGGRIPYNRPDPRHGQLVVCRPAAADRVLAALREAGIA